MLSRPKLGLQTGRAATHSVVGGASIRLDLSALGCVSVSTMRQRANDSVRLQFALVTQLMQTGEAPFDFGQDFEVADPVAKDSWCAASLPAGVPRS